MPNSMVVHVSNECYGEVEDRDRRRLRRGDPGYRYMELDEVDRTSRH